MTNARETMAGAVYLIASGQDGMLPKVAAIAHAAVGGKGIRVAVTYSPVAGDPRGLKFMSGRMARLFPGATLERFSVNGEDAPMSDEDARSVIDRADLIFVSGGDPSLGATLLARAGAGAWLRGALARGVPLVGVSAGAIMLGSFWANWASDEEAWVGSDEDFERTGLVECIGAVPRHVFDTHNEEDDWDELRLMAELCARRGKTARFIGIPTGGALVFHGDGAMEAMGAEPFVLE